MVKRVVYVMEDDNVMTEFPIVRFNISPTNKAILEHVKQGEKAVSTIAVRVGIPEEWPTIIFVTQGDGFNITSGKLAVI